MQQDYYPEALAAELAKSPPAADIHVAPTPVEPCVPVHYSLRFVREELNQIAAVQEWSPRWAFGDNSDTEVGWDVYHRFANPGAYAVSATLVNLKGEAVQPIARTVAIEDRTARQPGWFQNVTAEAKIDGMRLGFVLIIALAAVFATARGTVEKAGIFEGAAGLIGLGFAADTLKNAMTDRPGDK